jgi:hypothetical protein
MYTNINFVYFRLLVREKAKIHRSHERVFNGLVVVIIIHDVVQFYCWLLCMDAFMTIHCTPSTYCKSCFVSWLSMCKVEMALIVEISIVAMNAKFSEFNFAHGQPTRKALSIEHSLYGFCVSLETVRK